MILTDRYLRVLTPAALIFVAALAGCSGGAGDDDDDDDEGDGGVEVDAGPPPCEPTGPETADGIDNDCDELLDEVEVCGDGSTGFATIAAGLEAAPSGGVVEVCPGTYEEMLTIEAKPVHLVASGGRDVTFIDANSDGPVLIVKDTPSPGVTLEGFTIREGQAVPVVGEPNKVVDGAGLRCRASSMAVLASSFLQNEAGRGGAIDAVDCALDVAGSLFEGNGATGQGGAVYLERVTGTIAESDFIGNEANYGGAVSVLDGDVTIAGSTLSGNEAVVRGGALYVESDLVVEDSTLDGNTCGWIGGAIYVRGLPDDYPDPQLHGPLRAPTFRSNTITNNVTDFEGGGLYSHWSAVVMLDNVISFNTSTRDDGGGLRLFTTAGRFERNTIEGNTAGKGGGGLKLSHVASLFIDNVVKNNTATFGGGGGVMLDNDSSTYRGGSVTGNVAAGQGGGIYSGLWAVAGGSISDVLIEGNQADAGGGLFVGDHFEPVAVRGLIIRGNAANRGGGVFMRAAPLTMTRTLIAGNTANQGGGIMVAPISPSSDACQPNGCPLDVLDLDFNVIYGNAAGNGAGVFVGYAQLDLANSIIAASQIGSSVVLGDGIGAPTWRYNLTQPATFGGMANPTGTNGNLTGDPKLASPNAGDFHLQVASPAVDAGDPLILDEDGSAADLGIYGGPASP